MVDLYSFSRIFCITHFNSLQSLLYSRFLLLQHAEDLRQVQSTGHRESTKLRGSLAVEAEMLSDAARKATILEHALSRLCSALNQQLHTQVDIIMDTPTSTIPPSSAQPSPLLLGHSRDNMLLRASEYAPTLHDFDNRIKPPSIPPPPSDTENKDIFVPVGPPKSSPAPLVNPLFNN
jgi:hypothetical protein